MSNNLLENFGIDTNNQEFKEIDIIDKANLQDQLNDIRKNIFKLMKIYEDVQNQYFDVSNDLAKKEAELREYANQNKQTLTKTFAENEEYQKLLIEDQALKTGLGIINNRISYYQTDLKILISSMYNQF